MKTGKRLLLLLFSVLFISAVLTGCAVRELYWGIGMADLRVHELYSEKDMAKLQAQDGLWQLSKFIENGDIDDLELTIYYRDLFVLYRAPLGIEDLINFWEDRKIVVRGNELAEHIDLLQKLCEVDLMPDETESFLDARLYYVFRAGGSEILDVVKGGMENGSVYVNGYEVLPDYIFLQTIEPFLPEEVFKDFQNHLEWVK